MKRFFYFLISIIFTFNAVSQTNTWNGNAEIWSNGNGSKETPFLIESASHLAYLSLFVLESNEFDLVHFELIEDLNLNNIEWIPIGTEEFPFRGVFNGNNHTISNLKIDNEVDKFVGLFGFAENSTISNLSISEVYIVGGENVGGISAYADNCIIKDCQFQGYISSNIENCHIGGICGYADLGKIINSQSSGKIETSGMQCEVGGIVGTSSGEIKNCENQTTIIGTEMYRSGGGSYIGGICGVMNNNRISKCNNSGTINSSSSKYYMACLGGIVGRIESTSTISGCSNSGDIQSDKFNSGNTGGICGWALGFVLGSVNSGNLETSFPDYYLGYTHSVGGICGSSSGAIACYNIGNVNCVGNRSNEVGGIIGSSYSGDFYACYNIGTTTGYYQGGICGYQYNVGKIYTGLWLETKSSYLEGRRKSLDGKSSEEELRSSSDTLNMAINDWNEKNERKCNFYFKVKNGLNNGYPILISQPIATTKNAIEITNNSAILNAEFELGDEVVIYQKLRYKKISDTNFTELNVSGEDVSVQIECTSSSDYIFQAYIVTEDGTYLGEELSFSTLSDTKIISLSGELSFGELLIGSTNSKSFEITNSGNSELQVSSIDFPIGFQLDWQEGVIGQGEKQEVMVTFAPVEAIDYFGEIVVNGNQTDGNNQISIMGKGIKNDNSNIENNKSEFYCFINQENILVIKSTFFIRTVSIYNVQGIKVYSGSIVESECEVNMNNFSRGVYIIHLKGDLQNNSIFKVINK